MTAYKVTCFVEHWIDDYTDGGYTEVCVAEEEYFHTRGAARRCKDIYDHTGKYSEVTITEIIIK